MYKKDKYITYYLFIILLVIGFIFINNLYFSKKESFDYFKIQEFKAKHKQWMNKLEGKEINEDNIDEYLEEINKLEDEANTFYYQLRDDLQKILNNEIKTRSGVRIYKNKNEILK